jgi:hypothetical protein
MCAIWILHFPQENGIEWTHYTLYQIQFIFIHWHGNIFWVENNNATNK